MITSASADTCTESVETTGAGTRVLATSERPASPRLRYVLVACWAAVPTTAALVFAVRAPARAPSRTPLCTTTQASTTRPSSVTPKSSRSRTGAMSANSTTASPRRRPRSKQEVRVTATKNALSRTGGTALAAVLCRRFEVSSPATAQAFNAAPERRQTTLLELFDCLFVALHDHRCLGDALVLEKA